MVGKGNQVLVTPSRAAAILDVGVKRIRAMIKDGKIKAVKIGPRGLRVVHSSLVEYVESLTGDVDENLQAPGM